MSSTASVPRCELPGCSGLLPDGMCPNGYGVTCESLELEPPNAHEERRGSSAAYKPGDRVRVRPEFDIPWLFRGSEPSRGVVDHINDGGTLIVVVDGKSVFYQPEEVEFDA